MILSYQNDKWQSSSIVDLPIVTCDNKEVYEKLVSDNYSMQPVLGPKGVVFAMKSIGAIGTAKMQTEDTFSYKTIKPTTYESVEDFEAKKEQENNRILFIHGLKFGAFIKGEIEVNWEFVGDDKTVLSLKHSNGKYLDVVFDYGSTNESGRFFILVSTGDLSKNEEDDNRVSQTYSCPIHQMKPNTLEWDALTSKINEKGEYHFRNERKSYF